MPIILIQEIIVTWTKRARGGPAAAIRNAIPEALPLPPLPPVEFPLTLITDRVSMGMSPKHTLKAIEIQANKRYPVACTSLMLNDADLTVSFPTRDSCAGAPHRFGPRTVLNLALGSWGKVRYNGRYIGSFEGHWCYQKVVLNIAYVEAASATIFLGTPHRPFSDMRHLF